MWHHQKNTAITAMSKSPQWLLSDLPLATGIQTFTFPDSCFCPLFRPVTPSCHGVPVLVCGCLQPKTGTADPQQERLLTNQSHQPHIPCCTCRGREDFSGSTPRAGQRPLQHEAVSNLSVDSLSMCTGSRRAHTQGQEVWDKYLYISTCVQGFKRHALFLRTRQTKL